MAMRADVGRVAVRGALVEFWCVLVGLCDLPRRQSCLPAQSSSGAARRRRPASPPRSIPPPPSRGPARSIARQVFDTLVAYREGTTEIEPALATRWSGVARRARLDVHPARGRPVSRRQPARPPPRSRRASSAARSRSSAAAALAGAAARRPGVVKEVRARRCADGAVRSGPAVRAPAHGARPSRARYRPAFDGARRHRAPRRQRSLPRSWMPRPGAWRWRPCPATGVDRRKAERLVFLEVGSRRERRGGVRRPGARHLVSRRVRRDGWRARCRRRGCASDIWRSRPRRSRSPARRSRQAVAAALDPGGARRALDRAPCRCSPSCRPASGHAARARRSSAEAARGGAHAAQGERLAEGPQADDAGPGGNERRLNVPQVAATHRGCRWAPPTCRCRSRSSPKGPCARACRPGARAWRWSRRWWSAATRISSSSRCRRARARDQGPARD